MGLVATFGGEDEWGIGPGLELQVLGMSQGGTPYAEKGQVASAASMV
jgi:hypothetical protein